MVLFHTDYLFIGLRVSKVPLDVSHQSVTVSNERLSARHLSRSVAFASVGSDIVGNWVLGLANGIHGIPSLSGFVRLLRLGND